MDQSQLPLGFWPFVVFTILKMLGIFTLYMVGVAYTTLAERKISAWIQDRHGPNRVGPWGLFQVLADGVKNIMKEETMPGGVNKPIFILAPAIAFVPALIAWAVIPFGAPIPTPWGAVDQVVADLPIGFLFTLGIASLGVYGIVLAGWASNNKYALLGGLRASAQMVSYEITMGMAVICVLLVSGNVSLNAIVAQQQGMGWNVMVLTVAGFLFLVSAFAETNRVPFDMPEAESELIAGYHSEYSAMKFSMFPISEYANMVTTSAMLVTLFFGGWDIPFTDWDSTGPYTVAKGVATFAMFAAKVIFFVFFYIWIRWTLPRFRYDQLMSLGWKVMLPIALVYLTVISAAMLALDKAGLGRGATFGYAMGALNLVCVVVLFLVLDRGRLVSPASARLSPDDVARLRRRAPARATLTPEEIR
ncbi:MAG: NADH-quinone oxidoreductase subunit NuoH [Gemmatimonadaceae bacterium]|nr:NADH-quinone oxidoreductase subunit NuoH [Gemmatimonadaceae bacterium]MCW5825164.1 NADH-quinone oxidoreductase subunit NuoH [Gemmatimonadaceae bacterium]